MKATLAFIAALVMLLIITSASAGIVDYEVGPYNVNFDLTNSSLEINSTASQWHSDAMWTPNSGSGRVFIVPKNHPDLWVASIKITYSESGIEYNPYGIDLSLEKDGWTNAKSYVRTIDGHQGTLTTGSSPNATICLVYYNLDENTLVEIESYVPMDRGTGDLLNTVHIGRKF